MTSARRTSGSGSAWAFSWTGVWTGIGEAAGVVELSGLVAVKSGMMSGNPSSLSTHRQAVRTMARKAVDKGKALRFFGCCHGVMVTSVKVALGGSSNEF